MSEEQGSATQRTDAGGSVTYTRFIILCAGRTGSNMLISALNASPNIISFREIFHFLIKRVDYHVDGYAMYNPADRALRDADFKKFLSTRIFCEHPAEIGAVGFKMNYNHFVGNPGLLEWLVEERNIRVLHLMRRNRLRMLVSLKIAQRAQVSVKYEGRAPASTSASTFTPWNALRAIRRPRRAVQALRKAMRLRTKRLKQTAAGSARSPISLDVEECREFFTRIERDTAHYDECFREHPKLVLYYEDLTRHYGRTLEEVQTFLDLTPRTLLPTTRKQNPTPLKELIGNYDELYDAFKGTPEAAFFDEVER